MQQGALFDSGILGASFHWWIGQIADDSTWRDNAACRPHESPYENKGWGRRYRVRIVGLHEQGEGVTPSEKLPLANLMYPVTAGSGNAASMQSPNLRQGNIVYGFFFDGQEMRIPVIMGVLGNNAQTERATTIGDNRVTDNKPGSLAVSGYATGKKPKDPRTGEKELPPDSDYSVTRPGASPENAPIPNGVSLDKYGLRTDLPRSTLTFNDIQEARSQAEFSGLSFADTEKFISDFLKKRREERKKIHESPNTPPAGTAYLESPDVQQISSADVKRDELYDKKTVVAKPDDFIQSAIKSIQTIIDNISSEIDKHLNAIQSYVDAVSNPGKSIGDIIHKGACELTKFMKVIFDKIMEFVLKQLNIVMADVVAAMPTSLRNFFGDIKEKLNEMIAGMYNEMSSGLCDQIESVLNASLNPEGKKSEAQSNASNNREFRTNPKVTVCQSETLTATLLAKNRKKIDNANTNAIKNINSYIDGLQSQMGSINGMITSGTESISKGIGDFSSSGDFIAGASSAFSEMDGALNMIPDITSGLGQALDFKNIIYSIFPGEKEPKKAISDFYQLATGGSGSAQRDLPSLMSVEEYIKVDEQESKNRQTTKTAREELGQVKKKPEFARPTKSESDVIL